MASSISGDGIVIQSDYVILLLGNHMLTGPGSKSGRGVIIEDSKFVFVYGGKFEMFGAAVVLDNSCHTSVRGTEIMGADEFADPPNDIAPQIGIMLVNSCKNRIFKKNYSNINRLRIH